MNIAQSQPKPGRSNRMLATVAVTLLAAAATAFVVLHHPSTQGGGVPLALAAGVAAETPAVQVDSAFPVAAEVLAKPSTKDEEPAPTF